MRDVPKRELTLKAKDEIVDALGKLVEEFTQKNGVPMSQQDEYKEALETQAERVYRFFGRWPRD